MVPVKLDYDPSFLNEETRDGYVVTTEMKKLWLIQLDILNEFIKVCDKYGLKYYAEGGTLLGAVRHRGYVPWDDDIDVILFREDYDKFYEIAKTEFSYPYYVEAKFKNRYFTRIKRLDTTDLRFKSSNFRIPSNRKYILKNLPCISIDIFCFDNYPEDEIDRIRLKNEINNKTLIYKNAKRKFIINYQIGSDAAVTSLRNDLNNAFDDFDKVRQKYNDTETKLIYNSCFPEKPIEPGMYKYREDYDESVYLPFEMLSLRCPKGYERVLDIHYTERTGVPWQTPTQNLAFHNQSTYKFLDFDNSFTKYCTLYFNKPEDRIIIPDNNENR